jgi:hypothetical protein
MSDTVSVKGAIEELLAAADEVNARYVGGSPFFADRFNAAIDRLALAALAVRRAGRGGQQCVSGH